MKLAEALQVVESMRSLPVPSKGQKGRSWLVALVMGASPLHLETFLTAELARRKGRVPTIATGVYGDLLGTLRSVDPASRDAVALVVEWSDLDERLGWRGSHGWRRSQTADVLSTARSRLEMVCTDVERIAAKIPVAVALPTIPFPPRFEDPTGLASASALTLRAELWSAARRMVGPRVRILDPQRLDAHSPPKTRMRLSTLFGAGFPYSIEHASKLGAALAEALAPPAPLKGIITDLDNTLWRGILGDDGLEQVSWSLDAKSHGHALYQELLASLAEIGVLVAVVSKNDPALVDKALSRADMIIPKTFFYPVVASWNPKSEGVAKVLAAWNVGEDAVLFVDDAEIEHEQVRLAFPKMQHLVYPTNDDDALAAFLEEVRQRLGKSAVTSEDAIRLQSLRAAGAVREIASTSSIEELLSSAEAEVTFDIGKPDERMFELVNKTNQFNLNGRRVDDATWNRMTTDPRAIVVGVSYTDKFGPLGKIGAIVAHSRPDDAPLVDVWVMSCRAFSRRIEHRSLALLFERLGSELCFDYGATERNGPLRELFLSFGKLADGELRLPRSTFEEKCPKLYGSVKSSSAACVAGSVRR